METTTKNTARTEMDALTAVRILGSLSLITEEETGVEIKGVRINSVVYNNKDGQPFTYEQSGDQYVVISLKAISQPNLEYAMQLIEDGEYQDATNLNMSYRATVEEAKQLAKGRRVNIFCEERETKDGRIGIFPVDIIVPKAKTSKNIDTNALLKRLKLDENNDDVQS